MDWNNDGKVDWKDYAILDSATSGAEKEEYKGESDNSGCLICVIVGLVAFMILKFLAGLFS